MPGSDRYWRGPTKQGYYVRWDYKFAPGHDIVFCTGCSTLTGILLDHRNCVRCEAVKEVYWDRLAFIFIIDKGSHMLIVRVKK